LSDGQADPMMKPPAASLTTDLLQGFLADRGLERHEDAADGPVGDLPVTDLDVNGVDEHHRIDAIEWPVAPFGRLLEHLGLLHDQVTLMMEGSSSFGVCDPAGD